MCIRGILVIFSYLILTQTCGLHDTSYVSLLSLSLLGSYHRRRSTSGGEYGEVVVVRKNESDWIRRFEGQEAREEDGGENDGSEEDIRGR